MRVSIRVSSTRTVSSAPSPGAYSMASPKARELRSFRRAVSDCGTGDANAERAVGGKQRGNRLGQLAQRAIAHGGVEKTRQERARPGPPPRRGSPPGRRSSFSASTSAVISANDCSFSARRNSKSALSSSRWRSNSARAAATASWMARSSATLWPSTGRRRRLLLAERPQAAAEIERRKGRSPAKCGRWSEKPLATRPPHPA